VYLNITGYDKHHTYYEITLEVLVTLSNYNPSLYVTEAFSQNNLHPNMDFVYTVVLTNTGEIPATDVRVLLRDYQDIITMQDGESAIKEIGTIAPGESVTIEWNLHLSDKTLNTVVYTDLYSLTMYFGFTTEQGFVQELNDNSATLYLRTSPLEQVDPVQEVTPTFSSDQSQVLSYAIFAIAIIIAALTIMFGLARLASNVNKWRYEDTDRKAGKTEKPPEGKPEMGEPEAVAAAPAAKAEDVPEPPEAEEEEMPEPPEDEEIEDEEEDDKKKGKGKK
jgi:hypothetical protein